MFGPFKIYNLKWSGKKLPKFNSHSETVHTISSLYIKMLDCTSVHYVQRGMLIKYI